MATVRVCDKCKAQSTEYKKIRGFRWMGLMNEENYKHSMFIKADLCPLCEMKVRQAIMDEIGFSMRAFIEEEEP